MELTKHTRTPFPRHSPPRRRRTSLIAELTRDGVEGNLIGSTRQQQLTSLAAADGNYKVHGFKSENDHRLPVSVLSLGLATAGFVFPPLTFLSLPGIFYAASSVFDSAYQSVVKKKKTNVDILVAIILTGSVVTGDIWVASALTWLAMYNRKLLARIKGDAKAKLIDVFRQHPQHVWLLTADGERRVPFESVRAGDTVVVQAGGMIPVDGQITDGVAAIDQHMLTGESHPAEKGVGDDVFATTIVLSGKIHVAVVRAGAETTAAQIGEILNNTINFKTDMQIKVEEIGDRSVTPMLVLSALSIPVLGPWGAIALLNAHPKFKPTMATYVGILRFFEEASRRGVLVKDGRVFDLLNQVDTVVFDKTGTLTQEQPHVGHIYTCADWLEDEILALAAAAETKQSHPIARAIRQAADTRMLTLPTLDDADYKLGFGITVTIGHRLVRVGSQRFIEMEGVPIPASIRDSQTACTQQGHILVLVTVDEAVAGAIELHATVRPEARMIINGLRRRGIKSLAIISGDHESATRMLAQSLRIDQYFAETLPEQKADLIDQLQQDGRTVCYIGDGINDALALRKAAVSISLSGASTVATDTAQVILMEESLSQLCYLFDLAKDFDDNMKRTSALVVAPHLLTVAGVFFWQWELLSSLLVNQIGLALGVGSALLPGTRHQTAGAHQDSLLGKLGTET